MPNIGGHERVFHRHEFYHERTLSREKLSTAERHPNFTAFPHFNSAKNVNRYQHVLSLGRGIFFVGRTFTSPPTTQAQNPKPSARFFTLSFIFPFCSIIIIKTIFFVGEKLVYIWLFYKRHKTWSHNDPWSVFQCSMLAIPFITSTAKLKIKENETAPLLM